MRLPITYYGNPILRKKGARVNGIDDELRQLVSDMIETLHAHDGLGLAAPQVSRSIALFITYVAENTDEDPNAPRELRIFINPKILEYSQEEWLRGEGCLSIPEVYAPVSRPWRIKVEATDLEGNRFVEEFQGLPARAIMHENDHINGVLFIDRVHGKARQEMEPFLRVIKKNFSK